MSPKQRRRTRHTRWLKAAALYNVAWGATNVLWPRQALRVLGVRASEPVVAWQTVGMMVLAYAPAYWWASKQPVERAHITAIGLTGKVLGPLGYLWAVKSGRLPLRFGLTIATNDLVWWPAFAAIVRDGAESSGGWKSFLAGTPPPADSLVTPPPLCSGSVS